MINAADFFQFKMDGGVVEGDVGDIECGVLIDALESAFEGGIGGFGNGDEDAEFAGAGAEGGLPVAFEGFWRWSGLGGNRFWKDCQGEDCDCC